MSEILREALANAARGWAVFPIHTIGDGGICSCGGGPKCSPGKHPRTARGLYDATTDPKVISRWWECQWPEANLGIATGLGSRLVVIDVDEDGRDTSWLRDLPPTVEAVTGSGGRHILFAHPGEGVKIGNRQKLSPGIDIRGDGGYIVAAPSLHASGRRYEWDAMFHPEEMDLAPLPGWLLEQLTAPRTSTRSERRVDEGVPAPVSPVLEGCAWLRHCILDAETLPEAEWYALLTIAGRLEEGERLAHQWSRPYPGYSAEETAEKLRHALRDTGPQTCAFIRHQLGAETHCATCVHWGQVKSPIALARTSLITLEPPPETVRQSFGVIEEPLLPAEGPRFFPVPGGEPGSPTVTVSAPPMNGSHSEPNGKHRPNGTPLVTAEDVAHAQADSMQGEGKNGPSELTLARHWAQDVRDRWAFFEGAQWYRYEKGQWRYASAERAEADLQHWLERKRAKEGKISVTAAKVSNILRLARNHLGPHEITELNAHPTWIPLRNGVFDTETGRLLPHNPRHFLTNQMPFEYDPAADCPRWKQFLEEVLIRTAGDPCDEWIRAMQEWFGYCLVPDNRAQVAMVWVGEGQNGKGVATRVIQQLVGGSQCCSVPIDQLHDPYHRAELHGKLVGFVNEPDPRAMLKNGAHFKAITGEDAISARRPTEKVFTFLPYCRLIISCNAIPGTRDLSRGFFRRLLIIEWRYDVPAEARDRNLGAVLRSELPGIFNWAIEGLRRFRSRNSEFEELPESEHLLADYRLNEDTLEQFIRWECERGEGYEVAFGHFYDAYRQWCLDNGYQRMETSTRVGIRLNKMGCPQSNSGARKRHGIRISPGSAYLVLKGRRRTPPLDDSQLPDPPPEPTQRDLAFA